MATNHDLRFGGSIDAVLSLLRKALPNYDNKNPTHVIAGLIWLDTYFGVHSDHNYVLVSPAHANLLLLMVQIDDPRIADHFNKVRHADQVGYREALDRKEDLYSALSSIPFQVSFTLSEERYPQIIEGQTIHIRVMNDTEVELSDFGYCTVAQDGEIIFLDANNAKLGEKS